MINIITVGSEKVTCIETQRESFFHTDINTHTHAKFPTFICVGVCYFVSHLIFPRTKRSQQTDNPHSRCHCVSMCVCVCMNVFVTYDSAFVVAKRSAYCGNYCSHRFGVSSVVVTRCNSLSKDIFSFYLYTILMKKYSGNYNRNSFKLFLALLSSQSVLCNR